MPATGVLYLDPRQRGKIADETTKRYAQLKEGVTELVMTSPDAATALIRRWVQD